MESYTGFAEVYDLYMDNVPYDTWAKNVVDLLARYLPEGLQPGGEEMTASAEMGLSGPSAPEDKELPASAAKGLLAELGCGTGEMTRRLLRAGYDMIGIDNSEEMLSIARGKDAGVLWLLQDMREFELYGTVAAVVSVCDSMNYLLTEEDLLQTLRLVNNYLDPGGIFLFDLNTVHKYRDLLGDRTFAENREEGSFIWENEYDPESGLNYYDLTLYIAERENGRSSEEAAGTPGSEYAGAPRADARKQTEDAMRFRRYEETHIQRAWETETVLSLLREAGLTTLAVLDTETLLRPTEDTERIYVIAREVQKG